MLSEKQVRDRDRRLARIAAAFARRPATAQEVADREDVAPATAYAWIKLLLQKKAIRLSGRIRGASGSWAKVYGPVVVKKNGHRV